VVTHHTPLKLQGGAGGKASGVGFGSSGAAGHTKYGEAVQVVMML
jgi:hypothetical protein